MAEETTTAETPAEATPEVEKTEENVSTPETDELGEAGKKALKSERDARKDAESKVKEMEAELSRLRRSNAANKGTDVEAIKSEIRAEFTKQLVDTAVKAEAKGRLQNAADALLFIDTNALDASSEDAIKAAVDKLIEERPYLAAKDESPKWGDVGSGQRSTSESEPSSPEERMRRAYSRTK